MLREALYRRLYPTWKARIATGLKRRRLRYVSELVAGGKLLDAGWLRGKRFLELGSSNGKDFVQFFAGYEGLELFGVDVDETPIRQANFSFHRGDAERLPFPDQHFDLTVSFGLLEHIQPLEKMARVAQEIRRVSRGFLMSMPSVSTLLEPHTVQLLWQLRRPGRKARFDYPLHHLSDEAWLQFEGFRGAQAARYTYLWPLLTNVIVYKPVPPA